MDPPRPTGSEPWVLHETILELLKRLNAAHERASEVDGLEYAEVQRAMAPFWSTRSHMIDLDLALRLLTENGLVATDPRPAFAWDRNRVLGERFLITTLGKAYLQRQLVESGRVP